MSGGINWLVYENGVKYNSQALEVQANSSHMSVTKLTSWKPYQLYSKEN